MLEVLKFIFSSFWVWAGTCILLLLIVIACLSFIAALAEIAKPRPPAKPRATTFTTEN